MASSSEPAMDFLDGSDVDEDNVGDVDQDAENVLLGSDEEESAPQQFSKSPGGGGAFGVKGRRMDRHSEEEEDVLNLVLQGDEGPLDFEPGPSSRVEAKYRLGPKVTEEDNHEVDFDNTAPIDYVGDAADSHDDGYTERKFTEDDDCDDGDDETETRNTRSRFTSERSAQSLSVGNGGGGGGSSVGIPIQTVGNLNKIRPGTPEGRPKHWNHNHNGPRPPGPRHPGRNNRFPHPLRPPLQGDGPHMRPNMMNPQIVQFNEGIFTDFNQPMRHPHARPRQPPPHGRFEPPRNMENPHRHPGPPPHPNNMRPNFAPSNQQRPFFPPPENQIAPRVPGPSNMQQMQQPPPPQPNFNLRGQRPPRFPPHMNHRHPRPPPHMNNQQQHNMQHSERPPFPPRPQRPPFGHGFPPHDPSGMNARMPNAQGYPAPPHHNMPPGFMPQHMHPNQTNQGRYMGAPPGGPPPPDHNNPFYMQPPPVGPNYHQVQEAAPYQQDSQWGGGGAVDNVPSANNPGHSPWYNHQQQQPQQHPMSGQGYGSNVMYEQTPRQNPILMQQQNMGGQPQIQIQVATHQLEVEAPPRSQIPTSIYIKPNSQIHEALSKGQFRPPPREEEQRRYETSSSSHSHSHSQSSSSRHYDDHYHERDRERSSNSRRGSSPSERRRDDDDYYDDRKSYHHERRSRRRYDDERSRSRSPEKKMSRSERSSESYHDHGKDKDVDNKSADKLLEEAKKMGLGEDYVKKLEEQRRLRERILKTKEQRRKQVKVGGSEASSEKDATKTSQPKDAAQKSATSGIVKGGLQKGNIEIEADSTVATGKAGKPKKILRIVRDKSGKIISKKVHVVVLAKPQQDGQQSTSTA
ncbi:unnamed protein product [Orchesella dallaii]|uniref:Uncharacterized protein n=1 Tax=Orchesella dallaii TaxID=48710 RepID=A0ABP1SAJ0_9HEXA